MINAIWHRLRQFETQFGITDANLETYIQLLHFARLNAANTDIEVVDAMIPDEIQEIHYSLSGRDQHELWRIANGYRDNDEIFTPSARQDYTWQVTKGMLITFFIAFLKALPGELVKQTMSLNSK